MNVDTKVHHPVEGITVVTARQTLDTRPEQTTENSMDPCLLCKLLVNFPKEMFSECGLSILRENLLREACQSRSL